MDNRVWIDVSDDSLVFEVGKKHTGNGVKFLKDSNITHVTKTEKEIKGSRSRMTVYDVEITDGKQSFKVVSGYRNPLVNIDDLVKMLEKLIATKKETTEDNQDTNK